MSNRPFIKRKTTSILIILLVFGNNYISYGVSQISGIEIAAEIDDIIQYEVDMLDQPRYQKIIITNITENSTAMTMNFNIFNSEVINGFNSTADNETSNILTGNLKDDIFSQTTFFNYILPLDTNFSQSHSVFQDLMNNFEDEANIKANFTIGSNGLCYKMEMFYRVLVLIKVMEMKIYYSTRRFLLKMEMYFNNPLSGEKTYGYVKIMPEYSTILGANETIPESVSLSLNTPSSYGEGIFTWDATAIISLSAIIGIGTLIIVKGNKWRKKRKRLKLYINTPIESEIIHDKEILIGKEIKPDEEIEKKYSAENK